MNEILCQNIKRLRTERNITRKELSAIVGVSTSAIGFYETGKSEPTATVLLQIARALHTSVDSLLGGEQAALSRVERYTRYLESLDFRIVREGGTVRVYFHDPNKQGVKNNDTRSVLFRSVDVFCRFVAYSLKKAQRGEEIRKAATLYNDLDIAYMIYDDIDDSDVNEFSQPPAPDCPSEDAPPAPMNKQAATGGRSNSPRDSLPSQG